MLLKGVLIIAPMLLLSGCDWWSSSSNDDVAGQQDSGIYFDISSVDYAAVTVDDSALDSGARQLVAQCAQCHGTFGIAVADWPDLYGGSRQISNWMVEYQDADVYSDNMMHLHALAYSETEVELMKTYFRKVDYVAPEGE